MSKLHVAVAICAFNNFDDVIRCIESLAKLDYADFEVCICENGSEVSFARLKAALPATLPGGQSVDVVWGRVNSGFAGGVNVCLRHTPDADAWWVLNPDTQPESGALRAMVETMGRGGYDGVGCKIFLEDGQIQSYGGHWSKAWARAESMGHGARREDPVDAAAIMERQNYLNGSSMLISRRLVETVGPMREDYFLYCEEVEWCLRAREQGLRLGYAPGAEVLHHTGTTTGAVSDFRRRSRLSVYLMARNAILLTRDLTPSWTPVAVLAHSVQVVVRYARRGAWRQVAYGLQGVLAGLLNQRGAPRWLPR